MVHKRRELHAACRSSFTEAVEPRNSTRSPHLSQESLKTYRNFVHYRRKLAHVVSIVSRQLFSSSSFLYHSYHHCISQFAAVIDDMGYYKNKDSITGRLASVTRLAYFASVIMSLTILLISDSSCFCA